MALRLDFTTLRIFLSVAETRNISRAAEIERIAPSAVSKRLSDLEYTLSAKLLYRLPRGVELTPAGEALRYHAQAILNSADRLAADLGDYALGIRGHVRMAANASSIAEYLPEDLKTFCSAYPDVNVDLQEMNTGAILKTVAEGRCDMGIFAGDSCDYPDVEVRNYRTDHFVLVTPAGHEFAGRPSIRFAETLSEYYVGMETMTAWDSIVSQAAAEAGETIRHRFRLRNILSVFRMVSAGLGVSVAPRTMVSAFSADLGLQVIPLEDAWAKRQLSLAFRSLDNLTPPARLMLDHLDTAGGAAEALV